MFILLNVNRYRHKIASVSIRINKIQATKRSKDYTAVGKRFFDRPKVMSDMMGKLVRAHRQQMLRRITLPYFLPKFG